MSDQACNEQNTPMLQGGQSSGDCAAAIAAPPRFTIVTPTCDSFRYLNQTIQSVLSQAGDFEIEYVVIDANKRAEPAQIVSDYAAKLQSGSWPLQCRGASIRLVSEADNGMYDAIGKGFDAATGNYCAWINSDDLFLPGAFATMARIFQALPEVQWLKGITVYFNEDSAITSPGGCFLYRRDWIAEGVYGREQYFIQQDSTFWRRGLWDRAEGISRTMKAAGDYDLWVRFARYAELYVTPVPVSGFRRVRGQLSEDRDRYRAEMMTAISPDSSMQKRRRILFHVGPRVAQWMYRRLEHLLAGKGSYPMVCINSAGKPGVQRIDSFEPTRFRPLTRHFSCPICQSPQTNNGHRLYDDRYGYPAPFRLLTCQSCGHGFLDHPVEDDALPQLYGQYYPRRQFKVEDYRPHPEVSKFDAWLDGLKCSAFRWVPAGAKVLDVGCGYCQTLGYHQKRGSDPVGVEVDENVRAIADRHGFDVRFGVFSRGLFRAEEKFDYITLDQVIEHMNNPILALTDAATLLKPGGKIVITTPNLRGWGRFVFRSRWLHWHVPFHCQFFTRRSMQLALKASGLKLERHLTCTSSMWLYFQWTHLSTYPKQGDASSFWTNSPVPEKSRTAMRVASLLRRMRVHSFITRVFDALGLGDNQVFIVTRDD